jgi:hypothetical protein
MPKSRNRKNHKQKVKARNQKIQGAIKKYRDNMENEMKSYLDKLSGMTESLSNEEKSEPVQ